LRPPGGLALPEACRCAAPRTKAPGPISGASGGSPAGPLPEGASPSARGLPPSWRS